MSLGIICFSLSKNYLCRFQPDATDLNKNHQITKSLRNFPSGCFNLQVSTPFCVASVNTFSVTFLDAPSISAWKIFTTVWLRQEKNLSRSPVSKVQKLLVKNFVRRRGRTKWLRLFSEGPIERDKRKCLTSPK